MKKLPHTLFFIFAVFVAFAFFSCENSSGGNDDLYIQDDKKEEDKNPSVMPKPKAKIFVRSKSLHEICIYSDVERQNLVAYLPANASVVLETDQIGEAIFYYTFLISLEQNSGVKIPFYDNSCAFLLATSANEAAAQTISFPKSIALSSCFVILKNDGEKAIQLMSENFVISPSNTEGTISTIINPGKSACYEIQKEKFDNLGAYYVREALGTTAFPLKEKIVAFDESKIYTIAFDGNSICNFITSINAWTAETLSKLSDALSYAETEAKVEVVGTITNDDITTIRNALNENKTKKVVLNLSGTTGLAEIGDRAFYSCSSLVGISIPDSVTEIKSAAFEDCASLTSVTIPDSVTVIGASAFRNCTNLANMIILATEPPLLKTSSDFNDTADNLIIYVPDASIEKYKNSTIWNKCVNNIVGVCITKGCFIGFDHNWDTEWKIDETNCWKECIICGTKKNMQMHTNTVRLTSAGEREVKCSNCNFTTTAAWTSETVSQLSGVLKNYTEAKIHVAGEIASGTIYTIKNALTANETKKVALDLSETIGLTEIGASAFRNCTNLAIVVIPNSVTLIGTSAFQDCTSLTNMTILATNPPYIGTIKGVFLNTNYDLKIYVPAESVDTYKAATGWKYYADKITAIEE